MKVVGITGRIGTGKSRLCEILSDRYGCAVIDADSLGHDALADATVRAAVVGRFGVGILDSSGEIDRVRLGGLVFSDPPALSGLNAIVHPWIVERILSRLAVLREEGEVGIVLLDAALLLHWKDRLVLDRIVLVRCCDETSIERLRLRGMPEEEARHRLALQVPEEQMRSQADLVVDNSGTPEDLDREAADLWRTLTRGEEKGAP